MNDQQEEVFEDIKSLIKICNDGTKGYEKAASNVEDDRLKTLFSKLAQQRKVFAAELEQEVKVIYGEYTQAGTSLKGEIHHFWQEVKATFTGNSTDEILEECIRGESAAIEAYDKVLAKTDIPDRIRNTARLQLSNIASAKEQMLILEKAF